MIVKIQTPFGWEIEDKVRKVLIGDVPAFDVVVTRHINVAAAEDGDHGPYTTFQLVYEDQSLSGRMETNGTVFLINDNGKTIDRI